VEDVKILYKKLAKEYHPDINKEAHPDAFKYLGNAYINMLKSLEGTTQQNGYKYKYSDIEEELIKRAYDVYKNCKASNIEVFIIGVWLWVKGETKPVKEELKKLGFSWNQARLMWYYGTTKSSYHKGKFEDIANKYGMEFIKKDETTTKENALPL
jgi:hypothetical protein